MFLIKGLLKSTAVVIALIALPLEIIVTAIGTVSTTLTKLAIKL